MAEKQARLQSGPGDLPDHHAHHVPSSGLGTKPIVASASTGAAALHSVPFSLGASEGGVLNWRVFIWCICFTVTLTVFIGEFCGLRSRLPFSWDGFLRAHAFYFSISCHSTSIILSITYINFLSPGSTGNWVITATAFAFVAAVLYPTEAFCIISSLEAWSAQASLPRPAQEARELC